MTNHSNFLTASYATVYYLKKYHPGELIYVMGTKSFIRELKKNKIRVTTDGDADYAKSERQFRVNGAAVPFPTAHQRRPLFIDFVTLAHAYSVHSFQDGKNVFCQ